MLKENLDLRFETIINRILHYNMNINVSNKRYTFNYQQKIASKTKIHDLFTLGMCVIIYVFQCVLKFFIVSIYCLTK